MAIDNVTNNKKFLNWYERKTVTKAPDGDSLNAICGKYLFARVDSVLTDKDAAILKRFESDYLNFETTVIQMFLFSELKYLAQKCTSENYFEYLERGDFSFLGDIVKNIDYRSDDDVRAFCDAVFYNGMPSIHFVKSFKTLSKDLRNLKFKKLKSKVTDLI
jgi:hypothetical protein